MKYYPKYEIFPEFFLALGDELGDQAATNAFNNIFPLTNQIAVENALIFQKLATKHVVQCKKNAQFYSNKFIEQTDKEKVVEQFNKNLSSTEITKLTMNIKDFPIIYLENDSNLDDKVVLKNSYENYIAMNNEGYKNFRDSDEYQDVENTGDCCCSTW